MACDEKLAARVRRVLADQPSIEEKAMFGGLAFLLGGRMCCGLVRGRLVVRVDPDTYEAVVRDAHASPMDFSGRPMRGFVFVHPDGVTTAPALRRWIARAVVYAASQPPQQATVGRARSTPRSRR